MTIGARLVCGFALAMVSGAPLAAWGQTPFPDEAARIEFFEKSVRPILADHCYNCHSANTNSQGGLRVDDRNGLVLGGDRGPAIVPGEPEASLLIQASRQTHADVKMPPKDRLSDEQIADVARWIAEGAAWPRPADYSSLGEDSPQYAKLREEHWAWQPLRMPQPPEVRSAAWPRGAIDRFLLARMEAEGLAPVADAAPLAFIRRLTFDLTGLPPTPAEIDEFVADWQPAFAESRRVACEQWVDRLLASPAYGERWGRHWLDVARYGESTGSARNIPYPHAWRYRDYVIDAVGSDKPYDRFLREQIAGDLLPAASPRQRDEQLIATGFLALGVCDVNQRFKVRFVMDNIDEQIDTVSRAVLALTVSCARCHEHKFDPIPIADYYALAGIFSGSDRCAAVRNKMGGGGLDYYDTAMLLELSSEKCDAQIAERIEQAKQSLADAQTSLAALQAMPVQDPPAPERETELAGARQQVKALEDELFDLSDPAVQGPVALGVRDAATVGDTEIRIRGEAEQLGPVVPRGFLSVFDVPGAPPINPNQSGRVELAEWLASPHNPLTPRVMANRVWRHLFGQGIVGSVDNFGVMGDTPSHAELLDYLAMRLIQEGWSVKRLIREIVLSRAYQLGSEAPAANVERDPSNRLVWRHGPRRLDAEEVRDAMLSAAGELTLKRPAGSPAMEFKVKELGNAGAEADRLDAFCLTSKHRSVYLPLLRGLTPRSLAVFDFAEQGMVTGSRDATTVPTQALYLFNDPFVRQQSQALAARLASERDLDDSNLDGAGRVHLAFRLTLGRAATPQELDRAASFLADYEAALLAEGSSPADTGTAAWTSFCQAIFASAEFRYLR